LFQGRVSKFGAPAVITSDRGAQFSSFLWAALCNLLYNLLCNLLGLLLAAREDDNTTPAQAVFGSPLILPGQFFDTPELPSEQFLEQFSRTLSATEHPPSPQTKQSCCLAAAAVAPGRPGLHADGVRPGGRTCPATPGALQRSIHHPAVFSASRHPANWRQDRQGVDTPTEALQRPHSAASAAQGQGLPASCTLPGFSPARCPGSPQGTLCPAPCRGAAAGTVSPWAAARGFCSPRRRSTANISPAGT